MPELPVKAPDIFGFRHPPYDAYHGTGPVPFGKFVLVLKDRILGNTEFQKTSPYVTGRPNSLRPSRREVKNDVS